MEFPASVGRGPLRALRRRDFRLYFFCQVVSMSGTWMQSMAQAWLVYELTASAAWVGVAAFSSQFTAFLACPLAGVVVDRHHRGQVLFWVQIAASCQAATLGILALAGHLGMSAIIALSIALGLINAFELTSRHAFAIDVVGREDLSSAIALNSIAINGSRILGPALGGLCVPIFGVGVCFLLNSASYLPAMYALLQIQTARASRLTSEPETWTRQWVAAIRVVRSDKRLAGYLGLATFVSFFGTSYTVLLPSFAQGVLNGDARTLGWLTSATGIGAVIGALSASGSATRKTLSTFVLLIGASLAMLALSRALPLSILAMTSLGVFLMGIFPRINNAIQISVDDQMRGRILSLYNMSFLGAMPLGSLVAGWLADHLGPPRAALGSAALFLAFGAYSKLRKDVCA